MKFKILLIATLIFNLLLNAQNLNEETIMGEWKAISVEIPNSSDIPQKEALGFIEDAFLGSKFNFKGNKIFEIEYGKTADKRIKELFFLDNQNWTIKDSQILIGTENNGFSSMHISVKEVNKETFFFLPMIKLKMKKLSSDKAYGPKIIESKNEKTNKIDLSKSELINIEVDQSQVVKFKEAENPPLAPDCKSKWDIEKKKECTTTFIQKHLLRKFNTNLASELGLPAGIIKIMIDFIIDTNGKTINITATGGPEAMNKNAIDVISVLPEMKPGIKNGKPINTSYHLPLTFRIDQ